MTLSPDISCKTDTVVVAQFLIKQKGQKVLVVVVVMYVMPLKTELVQNACRSVFSYQQSSSYIIFTQEQHLAKISKHGHADLASYLQRYEPLKLFSTFESQSAAFRQLSTDRERLATDTLLWLDRHVRLHKMYQASNAP